MKAIAIFAVAIGWVAASGPALAQAEDALGLPDGSPLMSVDLATAEGAQLVAARWRYSDVRIVDADFVGPGPDGQPTGVPVQTYDVTPHAGGVSFDDSGWETIDPTDLAKRRGNGRIAFNWYRIRITVPDRIGDFDPAGTTIVFETSVDDYAEVWVDGELTRGIGQRGGSVVSGWNASNRLVIGRNVRPGQQIQLAVFGANGPLSSPPTNYIWMRSARLDFFPTLRVPLALAPREVNVDVLRADASVDSIVGANPKVYKLAEGFTFTEGPVWIPQGGYLLFSDPNENRIYRYTSDGQLSVFRERSGYDGTDIGVYRQPGSNGLTVDNVGKLAIAQHGRRRVVTLEADGSETVVVDRYRGKRLNSPNDLVYRSDGALFITDPPFGLPLFGNDPRKEIGFSGVYSLFRGELKLVTDEMTGPNGIAFSPDEKFLYVGNWDENSKVVMRFEVAPDATTRNGTVFFDMTHAVGDDAIDGIKVDQRGNVYVSGPGGLWILSPTGRHLGTIITPKHVHNMAWGDADGRTLYLCAQDGLYRMRLQIPGLRPRQALTSSL